MDFGEDIEDFYERRPYIQLIDEGLEDLIRKYGGEGYSWKPKQILYKKPVGLPQLQSEDEEENRRFNQV